MHISDRTHALWAEMQATLEEVEMSASRDTRVFGSEHIRKLTDLRSSQIDLAQAWARSEADDAIESAIEENSESIGDYTRIHGIARQEGERHDIGEATDVAKRFTEIATNKSTLVVEGAGGPALQLEDETELDILLTMKRRQANDEYFQRVRKGVIDVVSKLEEVAISMRLIEQETKDI